MKKSRQKKKVQKKTSQLKVRLVSSFSPSSLNCHNNWNIHGNVKPLQMTYIAMATAAIKALKDRTGSSSAAIKKYIVANYPTVNFAQHSLRQALKKGVADGLLTTVKSSYKLTDKVRRIFFF